MPSVMDSMDLPPSSSPFLQLVQANEAEMIESSTMNAATWRGSLTVEDYLKREAHLRDTDFIQNGGITYWILVDVTAAPSAKGTRRILASCETYRKKALVAQPNSEVEDVVSHGIGSVFCPSEYRGRGFAQRMLTELAKVLDTWQQKDGKTADFTVLWSDIGKRFYARLGWDVYPSTHIELPPKTVCSGTCGLPKTFSVFADDLKELCRLDEQLLRAAMPKVASAHTAVRIALIPDAPTMQWHHAREEFLGQKLCDKIPFAKGAWAKTATGTRAWCIWTRTFGATRKDDVLNILRLVVEDENAVGREDAQAVVDRDLNEHERSVVATVAAILEQAQFEANSWGMSAVQLWNPSPLTCQAAKKIEASTKVIDRDDESINSLRWHGKAPPDSTKIDWIANEKYAWC